MNIHLPAVILSTSMMYLNSYPFIPYLKSVMDQRLRKIICFTVIQCS